jgi:hypothetical protein
MKRDLSFDYMALGCQQTVIAEGWYGAALDNWSHAAPALTLLQLARRAALWEAILTIYLPSPY